MILEVWVIFDSQKDSLLLSVIAFGIILDLFIANYTIEKRLHILFGNLNRFCSFKVLSERILDIF